MTGFSPWIEIAAGSTTGSMQFTLHPILDKEVEGNETIKLTGTIDGLRADEVEITLTDSVTEPPPDDSALAFVAKVESQTYTAGTAIDPLVLPPASGGKGALTYVVSSLPAGLSFDWATRTISGTPTATTNGPTLVIYTVIDEDSKTASLLFFITVNDETPNTSDETASTAITLSASPSTVSEEIEDATVRVTATLNGGALASDVTVNLSIDPASTAEEDEDYELDIDDLLVIRAGSTSGSTEVFLEVEDDGESEGSETIILNGSAGGGLTVSSVEITLTDQAAEPAEPDDSPLAFAASAVIDNQEYTAGKAITPLVLPEAMGGTAPLTYSISSLPAGLSFDSATRTISGTPTAATDGASPVVYQVTDADGQIAVLTFTITVNKKLTIDLSDLFGSGKVVPTDAPNGATIREFVVGQRVDGLVLPVGRGGRAPLTYSLSPALPAGLTFDPATRTIAGTPQAASEAVYTYTVTDANGARTSLVLQVLPAAFSLAANFPNPFNPATTIQYALPQAADVELTVYNVVGQVVRTLVAEHQGAGRYTVEWDATDDGGHSVSAGLYLYRLQAGGEFAQVKKMLLLK